MDFPHPPTLRSMEGASLIILCAWCEQEGRPAVLYKTLDDSSSSRELHSHGICKAHRDQLLIEMQMSLADGVPSSLATSSSSSNAPSGFIAPFSA
jgi:hypothetical protein